MVQCLQRFIASNVRVKLSQNLVRSTNKFMCIIKNQAICLKPFFLFIIIVE